MATKKYSASLLVPDPARPGEFRVIRGTSPLYKKA